jgi:hypothetical protein
MPHMYISNVLMALSILAARSIYRSDYGSIKTVWGLITLASGYL